MNNNPLPAPLAVITSTYHPVIGGAELQARALLPRFARRGFTPVVITRGLSGQPCVDTVDGITVYRYGSDRYGVAGSIAFVLGALYRLMCVRPAAIYSLSLFTPATIGALYSRVSGCGHVVKILRGGPLGDLDRLRNKPFFRLRQKLLLGQIDFVQVISEEIAGECLEYGLPATRLVDQPNGVDVKRLDEPVDTDVARRVAGLPAHARAIVYVGRLVPEKRVDNLIRVFDQLQAADDSLWLVVVGQGSASAALKQQAAAMARVVFVGRQDDVRPWFRLAALVVQPSSTEGMSNTLLEAMAHGRRIVSTAAGAAPLLLGDNERGVLIPVDDENALRSAVSGVLRWSADATGDLPINNPDELAQAAREYILKRHNIDTVADRLIQAFRLSVGRA